jgi:ATP/maltotriose-dependent transcriptional regulator MalT
MPAATESASDPGRARPPGLLLTKLFPPPAREQILPRERLVERLRGGSPRRLTIVAAPAGSGKTTLLAAWRELEATQRPVGWLSLDEDDNDPVVLWRHVIEALRRVSAPLGESVSPELVGAAPIVEVVLPRLVNELAQQDSVVLILDDFQRLSSGEARDGIAWLIQHAPPTFRLVLGTRIEPPFPLAALRAHGELLELRADDLHFTIDEADDLLNSRLGLEVSRGDVEILVERTEGWPAGLYLAALSLGSAQDRHAYIGRFGATSRHIVDFLTEEVLERSGPATLELMVRCSILNRLCGPLCDAVLDQDGAADQLAALTHTNLFLIPLDDTGEWYRFHHLFAELLRLELQRREPEAANVLHLRAYAWHREHGTTDEAIHHALEAGAFAEAGELISGSWMQYMTVYRFATIFGWLARIPDATLQQDVRLLLVRAWMLSVSGRRAEAEEAVFEVEQMGGMDQGPLPDGFSSVEASLSLAKAVAPWGDVGAQRAAARRAAELEAPGSTMWPLVCWAVAWGCFYSGELGEADRWFGDAAALASSAGFWTAAVAALAYRSLIAGDGGRLEEQQRLADEAEDLARAHGIDESSGTLYVALGASLGARGRIEEAMPLVERAVPLVRRRNVQVDLADVLLRQMTLLERLGEREQAAAVFVEAKAAIDSCPDPGVLRARLAAVKQQTGVRKVRRERELSERELTVLRLLSGSLTERDIGRELYLSHNTVHAHVRSIYRKLGVFSRGEAVERAHTNGLL